MSLQRSILLVSGFVALGAQILAFSACSAGGGGELTGAGGAGSGSGAGAGSVGQGGDIDLTTVGSTGAGGAASPCGSTLDVTYRDFSEAHSDFEKPFSGDVVRLQLVEATLGADLTPVFRDSKGCPQDPNNPTQCANWVPNEPVITSKDTFSQWYHTVDGVNVKLSKKLTLTETPAGSGNYVFDSAAFFPLAPDEGLGITPKNNNPEGRNFLFTTEIHLTFEYKLGQKFTFRGDDDLWIFVNNKLALDLGSMHSAEQGTIDFDAQAAQLGITPGQSYAMDIFQAERHTSGSNFRFETNISCFTPVDVPE
jgi:fibro-slime domain-containing protein